MIDTSKHEQGNSTAVLASQYFGLQKVVLLQ